MPWAATALLRCSWVLGPNGSLAYQMLAEGNSNKEIADRLNLSLPTVETHRTHIMEKLGAHSAAELVLSAGRRGADRLKAAGNTATAVLAAAPAEPTIPLE